MEGHIQVLVLGPIGARVDGELVDLGGPRQRRLLAALAVEPGTSVGFDRVVDRVWAGDDLPNDPRRTLRTYLTRLRQALGDGESVLTVDEGWRLNPELVVVDCSHLDALTKRAAAPELDAHARLAVLDEALALFRGRPFGDLADDDWLRGEAERLTELKASLVERRYQAMLDAGKHTDAVPGLAAEVDANPLRDRLVGLQMLALFRTGRQAEASRVFQEHRERLLDELGLEPGAELADLDRRIVIGDPSLLLTDSPGRALRGYRLGEQLGEGAFAMVYRGTQPSVGRDVAVKIIRSELANRPEFIRRSEAEAHLVARLEHPHIVPLYDYWREPDRACLVLRYLRGGTLEARLTRSGPLPLDEAVRFIGQIGAALTAAHEAGVVHRDVKPANVFLDESGNYYLGDFGIALEAAELSDPTAALSAGSPAYAAPEQLRREAIGPAADVHGLGISLYEALTARLPFPDAVSQADLLQRQLSEPIPAVGSARHDLPSEVDDVLGRATSKDPESRFQSVDEFVTALSEVVGGAALEAAIPTRLGASTMVSGVGGRNPFKGLRAFTEADAGDFRGRERLVDRLVELLGRPDSRGRIAAVVGPSGIGKSSVVRAGLLPALRRGVLAGSDRWYIATMAPGSDPFGELAAALLRVATHTPDDLMGLLTDDERGIARLVKVLVPEGAKEEVLLVIDQFEELFTLVDDDQIRRRFLDGLAHAVTDARCPLRVVLTMRADFWDRPLRYGVFARLIEHSTVPVTALAPDELERAIVEPALSAGAEFEPGLVSEIAADVSDQPGALPLLQYALTELWERRVSDLLTRDAYRELGGVAGALTRRAEELYDAASETEGAAVRRVFGRLVTPGEGTEDTRRRALRAEVAIDSTSSTVVDRYGAARLLSFDTDPTTREPMVEVAHEALIREWPRLRGWLDEDRDELRLQLHLRSAARDWDLAGRPDAELYRGGRLESVEEYLAGSDDQLGQLEDEFVRTALKRRRRDEEAEQERFDTQVRNNRRLRALLTGVASLLVVALVAGGLAVQQQGQADEARSDAEAQAALASEREREAVVAQADAERTAFDAETRRLAADAVALVDTNPDVALLLAAEAHRRDPTPETVAGLQGVLTATGPYLGAIGRGENFLAGGWLDDGTIVGLTETSVRFHDGETHELIEVHELSAPVATPAATATVAVAFDAVGSLVAVGSEDGSVTVIEASGGSDLSSEVLNVSQTAISAVEFDPDRRLLAVGDFDGRVHLVDRMNSSTRWSTVVLSERSFAEFLPPDEAAVLSIAVPDPSTVFERGPRAMAFEPGESLLVAAGLYLRRLDLQEGLLVDERIVRTSPFPGFPAIPRGPMALSVLPDGSIEMIAGASAFIGLDPKLRVSRDAAAPIGRILGIRALSTADDATGTPWFGLSNGQLVRGLVDAVGDETTRRITGLANIQSLVASPDGSRFLVAGRGGLELWSADGHQLLGRAIPRGANNEVVIASNGSFAAATNLDLGAESIVYDLSGSIPRRLFPTEVPATGSFRYPPDPLGRHIVAIADEPGGLDYLTSAKILDARTLEVVGDLPTGNAVTMSDDGSIFVVAGFDFTVTLYSYPSGERMGPTLDLSAEVGRNNDFINNVDLDRDSDRLLVSFGSGLTRMYEIDGWDLLAEVNPLDRGGAVTARFLPDGDRVVTRNSEGTIVVRDAASLERRFELLAGTLASDQLSAGPFVSSGGEYLLTTREQRPRLIDIASRTELGAFPNDPGIFASANDAGPQLQLITGVGEHGVIWNLDVDSWPSIACRAAGRNLTKVEWDRIGPDDMARRATCPQWGLEEG